MYPHISKGGNITTSPGVKPLIEDIPPPNDRTSETQTIRNISPADNTPKDLESDIKAYYRAKELEREMVSRLDKDSAPKTQKRRSIGPGKHKSKSDIKKAARIAELKEKRRRDKELAKEARYAKEESKYIFNPRRFMLGPLGERVGLGHAYLRPERPGLERTYEETDGFRIVRLFDWIDGIDAIDAVGVAARVELAEEPFPLESLILQARQLDKIRFGRWETREQYRSQIMPVFTKAGAVDTYITYGHLPKFTFTYDYREVYHNLQSLWGTKDQDTKTFEFKLEDTRKWYPIGYITFVPGYKYQIWDSENARSGGDDSGNFHRDVYFLETLWAPSGTLEFYTKVDAHKDNYHDITWKYSPWHWGVKGEVRKKILPWQMNIIAGYEHSFDKFSPFENFLRKDAGYIDIGKDFTGRLRGSTKWEFVYLESTEDDNTAPLFAAGNPDPYQVDAKALNIKNKLQYEMFKNIFVTGGADYAMGFDFDDFNNFGLYTELEYYNAGYFRCNFGYRYTRYYTLGEELNTIYFRCFLFM